MFFHKMDTTRHLQDVPRESVLDPLQSGLDVSHGSSASSLKVSQRQTHSEAVHSRCDLWDVSSTDFITAVKSRNWM